MQSTNICPSTADNIKKCRDVLLLYKIKIEFFHIICYNICIILDKKGTFYGTDRNQKSIS